MSQLAAGKYHEDYTNITFHLQADLSLKRGHLYHLSGANGIGKSTFLSRVLAAELSRMQCNTLFISQDIGLQAYTFRAYLGLMRRCPSSLAYADIISKFLYEAADVKPVRYLILDEVDKYFSLPVFLNLLNMTSAECVFVVSHVIDGRAELAETSYSVTHLRLVNVNGLVEVRVCDD